MEVLCCTCWDICGIYKTICIINAIKVFNTKSIYILGIYSVFVKRIVLLVFAKDLSDFKTSCIFADHERVKFICVDERILCFEYINDK